jgi:hypothetical protein
MRPPNLAAQRAHEVSDPGIHMITKEAGVSSIEEEMKAEAEADE